MNDQKIILKGGRITVMTTPKVLILILASDNQPVYREHQRLWRSYMKRNPNAHCYFYKGNPDMDEPAKLEGDTLYIKIEDTLDTVYEKTLRAFEFFAPVLPKYKCVFRTNLSSVVVFDRYIEYCRTVPEKNFCSAHIGYEEGVPFPAGAGFTLTPDLVLRLVEERPPRVVQDDVSIGHALRSWGIPIHSAPRVDFIDRGLHEEYNRLVPPQVFHFRIKQNTRHYGEVEDEITYEIDIMQKVIAQYYDDPSTRTIEVIMRMCPESRSVLSGDGTRPAWFTKEGTFRSVFLTKGANVHFTVLFDGDPTDHWIHKYGVRVVQFSGGDGDSSFLYLLNYIRTQSYPDNTIVYCLEDDYPHKPGWTEIVREGFSPMRIAFDYITLYDHRDKYTYEMYRHLTSEICVSKSVHWRTIPSTTNTWITLAKTLREDFDIFWAYKNQDHEKFLTLGRRGRKIGSCIPGFSTHAHIEHLSPGINWESVCSDQSQKS